MEKGDPAGPPDSPAARGGSPSQTVPAERVMIKDVRQGMNVRIKGCLMQVYKKKPFFEVCSQCGGRIKEGENGYICNEHGKVTPMYTLMITGVFDDGSANIRAVLFRDHAEKLFGKSPQEVKESFSSLGQDAFWLSFGNLGSEYMIEGRVKMNDFSKELEVVANSISDVDVKEECRSILTRL